ncbi:MAG TPA: prepilin-type N-terminal cleavage/methylation domain-containing protein [bacterium]|nr:prepilin-type N-terminal cleavage/methylation domain-containing protein [bacterium]
MKRHGDQRGFTLIEVLMTIVIIGILAAVAMRSVQSSIDSSRIRETQAEMDELIAAIAGNPDLYNNGLRSDFGYVGDIGAVPTSLDNLISNPGGYVTWKGPYVSRRFAQDAQGFKKDAWGNDYTFTDGITLASTGGGAVPMTKSAAASAADLTATSITGTVTDAAGNPPGDSAIAVTVSISYPDGAGGTTSASTNPSAGGSFTFNSIPVGVRQLTAVYRATNDTAAAYVASLPGDGATAVLRLPGAPFAASGGGGGGGTGGLEFVFGSASSPNQHIYFSVWNSGSSPVSVSSLTANWTTTAYYQIIRWGGTIVFNSANPKAGRGELVTFSAPQTLAAGQFVQIRLENFTNAVNGGANVSFTNEVFSIQFSNGSSIAFNSN